MTTCILFMNINETIYVDMYFFLRQYETNFGKHTGYCCLHAGLIVLCFTPYWQ